MRYKSGIAALALAGAIVAAAPAQAGNVVAGNVASTTVTGTAGVLRAGSPWGPGSTPSSTTSPVDGTFEPEQQQWNNGSFWWDQDASVNSGTVYFEFKLDQMYKVDRFVVQADDNDTYLLEYWDGSMWQNAYAVPFLYSYGLRTRDSGLTGAIMTDRFRISATAGDNYYAVSEIQAFSVPEPTTWAMLILGLGAVGAAMRRRQRVAVAFG